MLHPFPQLAECAGAVGLTLQRRRWPPERLPTFASSIAVGRPTASNISDACEVSAKTLRLIRVSGLNSMARSVWGHWVYCDS